MSASTSPPNPNALGTLEEAVGRINAVPAKPTFMIHAGDISHLSKISFDDADRIISQTRLDVHYVPGRPLRSAEHRMRGLPGQLTIVPRQDFFEPGE